MLFVVVPATVRNTRLLLLYPEKLSLDADPPWIHQLREQFLLIVRYVSLSKIKQMLKVIFLELSY